jgi:hypothetical protein
MKGRERKRSRRRERKESERDGDFKLLVLVLVQQPGSCWGLFGLLQLALWPARPREARDKKKGRTRAGRDGG